MSNKSLQERLELMSHAAKKIIDYRNRSSLEELQKKDVYYDGMVKQFEQLGEQPYTPT